MRYFLAAALGLAAGLAVAQVQAKGLRKSIAACEENGRGLLGMVGAACEPIYAAVWVDYDCPPLTPARLRQFVCPPKSRLYRSAALEKTLTKVRSLGTGAVALSLYEEKGAKETEMALEWDPSVRR